MELKYEKYPVLPLGVLKNRMEAGNAHGTDNCSLASRDFTVLLCNQLFNPTSCLDFLQGAALFWRQVSPGHEAQGLGSFQDGTPRQLSGMESEVTWPQG